MVRKSEIILNAVHKCIQWRDGEMAGIDMMKLEDMVEGILQESKEMENIKPNQILIGSTLLYCVGVSEGNNPQWEPTKLHWQDIKWCEEHNLDFNTNHRPLKLTTTHFVLNGFTEDNNGHFWKDLQTHYLEFIPMPDGMYPVWAQMPEMNSEPERRTSLRQIQYFHEFQTLLFTLTGAWVEKI